MMVHECFISGKTVALIADYFSSIGLKWSQPAQRFEETKKAFILCWSPHYSKHHFLPKNTQD